MLSILLLVAILYIAYRVAPRERQEDALVHGAGQVGLAAAVALFGIDYFTSYYYASGELLGVLHPYGLQKYAYIAVATIALANFVFGALYMYAMGVFSEGGGSFAAAMRYLGPSMSLIVAVVLIQDYVLTIVVSTLSGADQLLSLANAYGANWFWHFLIGATMAAITWYLTIRGRGESAQVVGTLLLTFALLTALMVTGLLTAASRHLPPIPVTEATQPTTLPQAIYHLLTASMKGMVALTGLEAMSNGIQFVKDEDAPIVRWGRRRLPSLRRLWNFYAGKIGIGRFVQTAFLFYGGLTTFMLTAFAIRFNAYDGTLGRTLVGNLAFIGFSQIQGGTVLYWAYQFLAVAMLTAASMTAYQGIQSMAWRNVAIGEIPEIVVYRNPKGTFTRPVTAAVLAAILIQLLVRGRTTLAVPYYGVGVFLPLTAMALAMRRHSIEHVHGRARPWAIGGTTFATVLGTIVFVGQIVGKWEEGGWLVLISLSVLVLMAHAILLSPIGYREPEQIRRIVREKARAEGPTGAIVEWQSLRAQEYRYHLLVAISRFWELFGVRRPMRFEAPVPAGDYDELIEAIENGGPSPLDGCIQPAPGQPAANPEPPTREQLPHASATASGTPPGDE